MDQVVHGVLRFDRFALDLTRGCLRMGDQDIDLRPKAFEVLRHLAENAGRLVPKEELFEAVWPSVTVGDDSLVQCIRELREKLGDVDHRLIKTVSRRGYLLNATLTVTTRTKEDKPAAAEQPATILSDRPSVAVLPFNNMSGDPDQDYFADGMAEDIITALSRCNSLFVIARNSSFSYKGKVADVRQIGRELGVRYVLEGSVRRVGSRLRITGQLVDAMSGIHIWADRFDGDTREVFELQDRITESVAAAVEPKVQAAEFERVKQRPAANLDAHDLLLRAQALEHEYTEESLAEALRCLEQALTIDPSYAQAMALAAYCFAERRQQGWSKCAEADTDEGFRLATRALDVSKDDASVLWMASIAVRVLGADSYRARELATRSLELNPNSAMALTAAGWAELFVGNPVGALELLQRAERLSPRDTRAWYVAAAAAHAHFAVGQLEEAVSCAKRALAQNPRFAGTLRVLAASLAKLGRVKDAAQVLQQALKIEPGLTLTKLRRRVRQQDESVLNPFLEGLRIAGLPE